MERGYSGGRGAVLIIGSLFWDDIEIRRIWRDARLDMGRAERMHAPIFYGRWSERGQRYTMTLARRGARAGGTAYVVPFQGCVDLEAEAQALWDAERRESGTGIGAAWGTIGALCRSAGGRRRWAELISESRVVMPDDRERTPLDADGFVDVDWPGRAGGGEPDCDVILVAVTVPAAVAPTPAQIGSTLLENEGAREYFYRNRLCDITTVPGRRDHSRDAGSRSIPGRPQVVA